MPRDHPRVCGEKCDILGQLLGGLRITPACAGKRPGWADSGCQRGDHPRACGEKLVLRLTGVKFLGSPPRVRGKARGYAQLHNEPGIIPACAGKSVPPVQAPHGCRDHPRVCGEKCPPGKFFFMTVGSPPRMRGKEDPSGAVARCPGITPACAGKSLSTVSLTAG